MIIVPTNEPIIARALSFGWWKRVYVGKLFERLPPHIRQAVLAHEAAHCDLHHTEKRILALIFAPFLLKRICRKQELDADKLAAKKGHAPALMELLSIDVDVGPYHPTHKERISALKQYEQTNRLAPVRRYSNGLA